MVAHIGERTPYVVATKVRREVMHGLPDHDQVIPDCGDMDGVPFGAIRIHEKHANLGYRTEDVAKSIVKISWTQSATASARAEAATWSSM